MVQVYLMNIADLPDPKDCRVVMQNLPKIQQDRILQFSHERGRKECLGARLLQHYVLKKHGLNIENVTYGEHKKPEIEGLFFNLSHSHDYAVCAVSDKAVGCDIEMLEKARMNVAKRFFHDQELQYLDAFSGYEQDEAFFRLWTMKESYIKMTGEGTHFPLNKFACMISEEDVQVFCEDQDGLLQKQACFMKEYELSGYKLTVCAQESTFAEKYIELMNHKDPAN